MFASRCIIWPLCSKFTSTLAANLFGIQFEFFFFGCNLIPPNANPAGQGGALVEWLNTRTRAPTLPGGVPQFVEGGQVGGFSGPRKPSNQPGSQNPQPGGRAGFDSRPGEKFSPAGNSAWGAGGVRFLAGGKFSPAGNRGPQLLKKVQIEFQTSLRSM